MSADRYELGFSAFDEPMINGSRALGYDGAILVEVIRQQARDIAELRADLKVAIGERNRNAIQREELRTDLAAAVARAEQAEARLAAIESAPVVASVGHGDYLHRHTANVPVGTLLIARPAKD